MTAESGVVEGRARPEDRPGREVVLAVEDLSVAYRGIGAIEGLSLEVAKGSVTALLGANGAGKTTTIRAISGLLPWVGGRISGGSVRWKGMEVGGSRAKKIIRAGIAQIPEGRRMFPSMTVEENLVMGGVTKPSRDAKANLERVYEVFPRLTEFRHRTAGYLSGGEQQMVAIGRALMSRPELLICDELSLGLAPVVVDTLFDSLQRVCRDEGVAVLIVEQNVHKALSFADDAYVLESGRLALSGTAEAVASDPAIVELYLGAGVKAK